jgi:ribonucleoside-triphosphate reductase
MSVQELADQIIEGCRNRKITISGGEPMCQIEALSELLDKLEGFDICLYTSHALDEVPEEILSKITYVKVGAYRKELRCTTIPYIGSTNQQFIKVRRGEVNGTRSYENASMRKTYVAHVFDKGERLVKEEILNSLPQEWSDLHRDGHIHIHDLDAYGLTYNCLTLDILKKFPYHDYSDLTDTRKVLTIFRFLENVISKVGNEQSGGMGFANFDKDLATIILGVGIEIDDDIKTLLRESIADFIQWCNDSHERMGQVSYYVTLNIGLADNELSRFICECVIDGFASSSAFVIKPNIVFKVKKRMNYYEGDEGRYLLNKALECSSRKMIPTYILCDSKPNRDVLPERLSIMGCRTRVVNDVFGSVGPVGRGNIDNITINLPRLAFESANCGRKEGFDVLFDIFKSKWQSVADVVVDILLDRYHKLLKASKEDFPTVAKYSFWCEDIADADSLGDVFKHGTLSIGFIGLSEAMEILSGKKFFLDEEIYQAALDFVRFMRGYTDSLISKHGLNFSLLATSGELISGRFPELDRNLFADKVLEKGFYTNSFHIDVDSGLTAMDKISKEAPFHELCNGGCITYVELGEAPIGNVEGLLELLDNGIESGTHYIGFNYPLDICNQCEETGVFDSCPSCGSGSITRVRRVSGYLEVLNYFVEGKKNEVQHRRRNRWQGLNRSWWCSISSIPSLTKSGSTTPKLWTTSYRMFFPAWSTPC